MVIILLKDLTTTTTKLILKEADNKTEALPRASKTIFEVGQFMQKKISIKAN